MGLLEKVDQTIQSRGLLPAGSRIVVGVSGGLDSMVLLRLLHDLAPDYDWQLAVAHLNHQLRGQESQADEELVKQAAENLFLPCLTESANVKEWARTKDVSIEMAARELRHAFLARAAREHQAKCVVLGHHAQDQVELFFLRLLRGAGAGGLSGMKWSAPSPADSAISLIRPLLDQPKSVLLDYSREHQVEFHEDATNAATDILRNRIRHKLVPMLLDEFQPSLDAVILRQMKILQAEDDYLNKALRGDTHVEPATPFTEWPVALQRRWIQAQLQRLSLPLDFRLIEELRHASDHPVMARTGVTVQRDAAGTLKIQEIEPLQFKEDTITALLAGRHGQIEFETRQFSWSIDAHDDPLLPEPQPQCEWFDADKIGEHIVLRHWQSGDRFQPIGMPRPIKLQDIYTNLKVPAPERRQRIIATTRSGEIWWVEGLRISEIFKIHPKTKRRLRWSWNS